MPMVVDALEANEGSLAQHLLVVNDEDILLASGNGSSSSSSNSYAGVDADETDSGYSKSNSPTARGSTASGCSSMSEREISFEGYGESINHSDNAIAANDTDANPLPHTLGSRPNSGYGRNSLRRSDFSDGGFQRRWGSLRAPGKRVSGSNALASQLYKNVNHNSSSRSSNGDNEDFCSDASLEDDVVDLGHKVQILQQQMTAIADTQFSSDDRYCRSRQENAALTARLQMLEESLRDVEMRAQQQLGDEQRRNKEIMVRVEREKQLEIENCHIKLQAIEREMEMLREESARLRSQTERLRTDRTALQQRLDDTETSLHEAQEELRCMNDMVKREREQWALEHASSKQLASELTNEVDALRKQINSTSESLERRSSGGGAGGGGAGVDGLSSTDASSPPSRVEELENEIKNLKQQNNSLKESNEELHAQLFSRGLEEGRSLLNEHNDNSLAAEFEVMSQEDIRTALREQQDVNASLRSYIEGILLTIVENQPSLLEVKPPCPL